MPYDGEVLRAGGLTQVMPVSPSKLDGNKEGQNDMTRFTVRGLVRCSLACVMIFAIAPGALAQDTDGDGMSDELERVLATNPEFAEELVVIAESPRYEPSAERLARYDITRVRFGNVARGRWLWAIEFAEPYTFENSLLILYVDSDNDPQTGRPGMGCETTYGHRNGRPSQMFYLGEEMRADFPPPRVGLEDGVLYVCADLALNQEAGRSKFRMMILSEQSDPHESRDSLGFTSVEGPGDSQREKTITLADLAENEGFEVTQSMELLWKLHADEGNVVLNAFQDCEYKGFEYNESEYRWPSVRKRAGEGTLTVKAPKAGRFWPGAVVYDGPGAEGYEMSVDGEVIGRFVAREDNRRQRLFFASTPVDFAGGETILLRAASTGARFIVEDIVLLAERPPILKPACEIRNLEAGYDWATGRMRATWITTWPVACVVKCDGEEIVEEIATQNHRVFLPELGEGEEYECVVEATTPGGEAIRSDRVAFTADEPRLPEVGATRGRVPLAVHSVREALDHGYAVTAGVPFARGALGSADNLRLVDAEGKELPLQARDLTRWPDGSVKVALVDTVVPQGATPETQLYLEYGPGVSRSAPDSQVRVQDDGQVLSVTTGPLKMEFDRRVSGVFTQAWVGMQNDEGGRVLLTRDDAPPRAVITDDAGNVYDTLGPPDAIVVEEAGPLRAVVRADGHHSGPTGEFFTYQIRYSFRPNDTGARITYRWGNDVLSAEFSKFRRIRLELPLAVGEEAEFVIGAEEPVHGEMAAGGRLEQLYGDRYRVVAAGSASHEGGRAPGWIQAAGPRGLCAIVCRQFWQLYPKAIGAENGCLYLDICPEFAAHQYNDCSELDLIKWFYYLQDGRYKVRQGMTKTHEFHVGFLPYGLMPQEVFQEATAALNEPPVLVVNPDYCASTGVFGDFVPKTAGRTPRYDEVCDRVYDRCVRHRDGGREFGMLNYGDQWGERRVNWSNGEYDHHHTAAQMFVRGAEARWHHLMTDMARHDIDVDLCHYHANPRYRGASWIHSMGHTGRYFTKQYQGEWGIPGGGMTVSHTWCEGTCEYYMLTGDPTAIEAARMIADHYGGAYLNDYDFTNGRIPGWHLLLTMAVYRTTYDPFYLNAAKLIVDRVLERRTPGGGWARQMVPGHCHCEPRCRGCCSFMQGILGCGLREYYLETRDERIPEAVVEAARYDIEQLWVEDKEAFRYTSCPKSSVSPGRSDTLAGILLFAYELSGDPQFLDVAQRSMNLCFESLGSLSQQRWTPYIVRALDRANREAIGIGGEGGATIMLRNDKGRAFEVRLFDREGTDAPAGAAELTGPDGGALRPDETGRIKVEEGLEGNYVLRINPSNGPWQVTSSLNPMVASLRKGLALDVPERGADVYLMGTSATAAAEVGIDVLAGECGAALVSPSGRAVGTIRPIERNTKLACGAAEQGLHHLRLSGPARVRMLATGFAPWAAFSRGRYFNASAPSISVEGSTALMPGQGRVVRLKAVTHDPEGDVVNVRWELPDGRVLEGREVSFEPEGEVTVAQVRAVAEDAEGNTTAATVNIRLLPPALANAEGVITLQAEDFSGQGGGEVSVFDRIGNVGKMITMWHADLGHWLEWRFEAPAEGEYVIHARYATDCEKSVRRLTIDGESPGKEYERISFARTGGYCTAKDDWDMKQLGPPVRLKAGGHSLRMTNLGEGLAMDYLSLVPVRP